MSGCGVMFGGKYSGIKVKEFNVRMWSNVKLFGGQYSGIKTSCFIDRFQIRGGGSI